MVFGCTRHFSRSAVIRVALILLSCVSLGQNDASADGLSRSATLPATTFTADQISDALLAAEAQYATLKLSYTIDYPGIDTVNGHYVQNPKVRQITQATYARKSVGNCVYYDQRGYTEDTIANVKIEHPGNLRSYDGNITITLDRTIDSTKGGGLMRAAIYGGRDDRQFTSLNTPDSYVWRYGGASYGELVRECSENKTAHVEVTQIEGNEAICISGKVLGGKLDMTLWVCPQLGFLPMRAKLMRGVDKDRTLDYRVKSVLRLGDGLYYPKEIEFVGTDGKAWASFIVSEASVDDIPQSLFRPAIPANTHVTDNVMHISYVTKENQNLFDASVQRQTEETLKNLDKVQDVELAEKDIDSYVRTATGKVEGASTRETADSQNDTRKSEQSHVGLIVCVIVGIALVAVIIIVVLRNRRVAK